MNYGLWLSATGVVTNAYRQDVIANNLANSETVGYKRNVALFQQRLTEAQARRRPDESDPLLDHIGGGILCSPTLVDSSQGDIEPTGNPLDVALHGNGFFAVDDHGKTKLIRDGRFMIDRANQLVMASGNGQRVLDADGKPITLDGTQAHTIRIHDDGQITQANAPIARLAVVDIPDPSKLVKQGAALLDYPNLTQSMKPSAAETRSGYVERANVDPATELSTLMDAQRQLEANANMIRYQDQTLGRLVNEVGKIG